MIVNYTKIHYIDSYNLIIMNYLRRLVSQFCGIQEDRCTSCRRHVVNRGSAVSCNKENVNFVANTIVYRDEEIEEIESYCRELPEELRGVKVSYISCDNGKKLLLLDLDKTLLFYTKSRGAILRPHLKQFLSQANKYYNIYIFTAATPNYEQQALHFMQQKSQCTQHILGYLTREHCIRVRTRHNKMAYIKDISIIHNCPRSQIVIIDDTPISFCLNPDNAIHIAPFQGQEGDRALVQLMEVLQCIKDCRDVREWIRGESRGSRVSGCWSQVKGRNGDQGCRSYSK